MGFVTGGQGDFLVQTERSEPFEYLTCVGVGDLPFNIGELTPVHCPDPAQKGKFKVGGKIRSDEPATNTTTLTRPLDTVVNWLLENDCGFEALVTYARSGARAVPENYIIAAVLFGCMPTVNTLMAAVATTRGDNTRIETTADIAYDSRHLVYKLQIERQSLDNTANANAVVFLPRVCESLCGPARGLCEFGYIALDGAQYNSEVKVTKNGGALWTQMAPDPFLYGGGDTSDVEVIEMSDGHRVIVSRGSAAVGEPAEVSYNDYTDGVYSGWTNVYVGVTNQQTIQDLHFYGGRIWAAASGGYIYVSTNIGAGWTTQEAATETTEDLNSIVMYSLEVGYAVGDNNAFLYTTDGNDWNARTGPAVATDLLSVAVNDKGHVFVGAADGSLYVSEDGGITWETRYAFGAGSVDWVDFDNATSYFGALIHNDAATGVGTLYRSIDGGATWWSWPIAGQTGTWNSGLNGGFICDQNNIYVVGNTHDGTTFVAKASPSGA